MKKQLTRQRWLSWNREKKLMWLIKQTGDEIIPDKPYFLLYKETNFAIRYSWKVSADKKQASITGVWLMDYQDGVHALAAYIESVVAVDNLN